MYERKVFERYFTEVEERQLLRTVADTAGLTAQRDHAWMRFLRHSGVRVCTLHGMNVSHALLALRENYLVISPAINKGKSGYKTYLVKEARKALQDLLRTRRAMGHPEVPDAPLLMSRNWRNQVDNDERPALSIRSLQDRMQIWVKKSGMSIAGSPHWWRHTKAKRFMKNSRAADPRPIVQAFLGHHSIDSTAVYTGPDREEMEQAMEEAG